MCNLLVFVEILQIIRYYCELIILSLFLFYYHLLTFEIKLSFNILLF